MLTTKDLATHLQDLINQRQKADVDVHNLDGAIRLVKHQLQQSANQEAESDQEADCGSDK